MTVYDMKKKCNEIVTEISRKLESGGITNHLTEARALLARVINLPVNQIHPHLRIDFSDEQIRILFELTERRINGEPLQLICGYVGFHNIILNCEKDVFIPRMETETLVTRALNCIEKIPPDKTARILDLGTGTGAVIIALAAGFPEHQYFGIDLNEKAIELAESNAEMNNVAEKIEFLCGDYFEPVRGLANTRFELIVSNPAYIKSSDILELDRDVRDWDPHLALDGGKDGIDEYRKIARELVDFLHPDGTAIFEIDPEYVDNLTLLFNDHGFQIRDVYKDLDGNDRVIEVVFN